MESEATTVGLTPAGGLSDDGLAAEVVRAHRERCRWEAREAELVGEAECRGVARRQGYASATAWLMALTGESAPACRGKLAVASALEEMPATREAFAAGEVSESRVKVLAHAQALAPERFAAEEGTLLAEVAGASPQQVPQVLAAWRQAADPAAAEAEAERLRHQRCLHLSADWSGMTRLSGLLDAESAGVVLAAVGCLSDPANLDPADSRTPAQVRADALVEISRRYLDGNPASGSARPHLSVTVPWDMLRFGSGVIDTPAGPITAETARRVACDATVSPVFLDGDGGPMGGGESRRVIPPAVRRALEVRDGHCTHPGCDVPARWCDAHHIRHWADGGKTELSNLRLLCRTHHTEQHHHQPYPRRQ